MSTLQIAFPLHWQEQPKPITISAWCQLSNRWALLPKPSHPLNIQALHNPHQQTFTTSCSKYSCSRLWKWSLTHNRANAVPISFSRYSMILIHLYKARTPPLPSHHPDLPPAKAGISENASLLHAPHSQGLQHRLCFHLPEGSGTTPPVRRGCHGTGTAHNKIRQESVRLPKAVVPSPGSAIFAVLASALVQLCSESERINFSNWKLILFICTFSSKADQVPSLVHQIALWVPVLTQNGAEGAAGGMTENRLHLLVALQIFVMLNRPQKYE